MIGAITAGLFAGGVPAVTNSYESIATLSGTGSSGTISFTSIPSTYKHLQLRVFSNTTRTGGGGASGALQFNGDTTGSNYYTHSLYGNGSSASAAGYNENYGLWYFGSTTTNVVSVIDILDYANTNKYKTVRELIGFDENGSGQVALTSMLWKNTGAVNQINLTSPSYSFGTTAKFALYGIKG
jgi:hypothetical protein